ncbi:hypothetical protein Aph01nite_73910 [Acrocarpospora phusangensis]|uniref:Uncharacterized protein n=1 Tax=Acrocarpospora phusangensis TaxID=1070424 RepID=A0A919QHT9_9ACTN|nr:hypothetical protein [Acrocarpospora phusangensis]GIH29081.1 hypothetical protein Aph01nite_73910 [Acrocarpospora phusangensis]
MADIPKTEMLVNLVYGSATVRPGHTLVVGCNLHATLGEVKGITRQLAEELPGVRVVVVPGLIPVAVYEPDEPYEPGEPDASGELLTFDRTRL